MIDFIFWNLVILASLYVVIKNDDFTILSVTYIVTLWAIMSFVLTTPFVLYGQVNSTDEYHELYSNETDTHPVTGGFHWEAYETHNITVNRETYHVPQNFLDIVYNVYMVLFTVYTGRKLLFTELGKKVKKELKEWWH